MRRSSVPYLDHNATTPVRPEVIEAMLPYFSEKSGNPASVHGAGRAARDGIDRSRRTLGEILGVHNSQIIFTSGGTESNNLALFGLAAKSGFKGRLVISGIEHPSVDSVATALEKHGMRITRVKPDSHGVIDAGKIMAAVDAETVAVSVMQANNETGVIQPVEEIAHACQNRRCVFHSDAVQVFGKKSLDFYRDCGGLLSLSAHKLGGPKGVGALVLDKSLALEPLLFGGGQERGRRSGTENLTGIVGFGVAAKLAVDGLALEQSRLSALRDSLADQVKQAIPQTVVFGENANKLANTLAMGWAGLDGETLVMNLDLAGYSVSSGSACSSGRTEPSRILKAMGVDTALGRSMIRVSLGLDSDALMVQQFAAQLIRTVRQLTSMSRIMG
ncbi:MAG: cysteine desulfurase [Magnetococcales bacterium]|nr:cysteine desulfurase [Magnetococcales bacterium]